MIERCPSCLGKKTLMGLGAMIKECHNCQGVGHIKKVEIQKEQVIAPIKSVSRGRPRKVNNERIEA